MVYEESVALYRKYGILEREERARHIADAAWAPMPRRARTIGRERVLVIEALSVASDRTKDIVVYDALSDGLLRRQSAYSRPGWPFVHVRFGDGPKIESRWSAHLMAASKSRLSPVAR